MNITEELNNMEENLCPIKEDCLFYTKPEYHSTTEKMFLIKYCLKGGDGCGLKSNYDISERIKKMEKYKRERR